MAWLREEALLQTGRSDEAWTFASQLPRNDLEAVPLRRNDQGAVFVRDVATVEDAADVTTSYAFANGRRTVYLPVTKRGDASTLAVVELVKKNLPEFQKILPDDIKVSYVFDQSPVVNRSIRDLLKERR